MSVRRHDSATSLSGREDIRSRGRQLCNFEYGPATIDRGSGGHAQRGTAGRVSRVMAGIGDTTREAFNCRLGLLVNSKGGNCRLLTKEKYHLLIDQVKSAATKRKKEAVDYRRLNRFDVAKMGGVERLVVPRADRNAPLVHYVYEDEVFDILEQIHLSLLHGGRTRMLKKIQATYKNITREIVEIYLSLCPTCRATRGDAFSSLQYLELQTDDLRQDREKSASFDGLRDHEIFKTFLDRNEKEIFSYGEEPADSSNDSRNCEPTALMNVECTINEGKCSKVASLPFLSPCC